MKNNKFILYIMATLAMAFWSMSFVWFKIVFEFYKPFTIVFFRLVISATLLILYSTFFKKKEKIKKGDMKLFFMLSFCEPFCYFLGESFGMQYVSATLGAIIVSTIPIVTPIFSFIFFKEKIDRYLLINIVVAFLGVCLIIGDIKNLTGNLKGILLMVIAVFAGTIYGFIVRNIADKYSSLTIVKMQGAIGALYFLPFFLIFELNHFLSVEPNVKVVSTMLQLAVFPSTLAFILFTNVIRKMGLFKSNLFTNLIPVFTAIFSFFVLKEVFTYEKIIGISLVVFSLFATQISLKKIISWIKYW